MHGTTNIKFLKVCFVFLLGNSPASEFCMPIQTPGNYPEESIQHSEHGESLKLRLPKIYYHCDRLPSTHHRLLNLPDTRYTTKRWRSVSAALVGQAGERNTLYILRFLLQYTKYRIYCDGRRQQQQY